MKILTRWISVVLMVCLTGMGLPLPASAAVISTDQVGASPSRAQSREAVRGFLDRQEVRERLQSLGVDADAARSRVDAMSDQEARDLAARIDSLPAGGDILGLIFTVFIVLLVTDILGLTKVFPFTRSVR